MHINFIQDIIDIIRGKTKKKDYVIFKTFHERPAYSDNVKTVSDFNTKSFPTLSIILQGPIKKENDFTLETVKLYKKHFPENTKIIISTWNDENEKYLENFRLENVHVVLSEKPNYPGISNVNYQIESSKNGLKYAKEKLNCEYAIKTRTDQRFYATNIYEYLFNLLNKFPLKEHCDNQKERLIALSLNTFKYRLFGISDMFLFGNIEDMILYWSPDYDMRLTSEIKKIKNQKDYSKSTLCEVYFVTQFLKNLKIPFEFTLENAYKIYAKRFIVIDKESIDLYWPKYTTKEYRWISYTSTTYEELTFKEWFNLYCDYSSKKNCREYLVELNTGDLIISRTACLGNIVLERFALKKYNINNHQKNRVDYILNIYKNPQIKIETEKVSQFIPRKDIRNILKQEEKNIFEYDNPKLLIMDSYAELTDKLFCSKITNSSFCSHYSDIDHCEDFDNEFECQDLLPINLIEKYYDEFFELFNKTYGNIPIIFINFPAKYDKREFYKDREQTIKSAIKNLCQKYKNIIFIDPQYINQDSNEEMPYHFSESTYDYIAYKIASLGILELK